jgi:hypothetical protein
LSLNFVSVLLKLHSLELLSRLGDEVILTFLHGVDVVPECLFLLTLSPEPAERMKQFLF